MSAKHFKSLCLSKALIQAEGVTRAGGMRAQNHVAKLVVEASCLNILKVIFVSLYRSLNTIGPYL